MVVLRELNPEERNEWLRRLQQAVSQKRLQTDGCMLFKSSVEKKTKEKGIRW